MQRSTEHILTTHTGSLPRPDDLVPLLYARHDGEPYDAAQLATRAREAVAEVVRKQLDTGLDVINDGEMGKLIYSAYVTERLSGFEGEHTARTSASRDLRDFPTYAQRMATGRRPLITPACTGPITYRDRAALQSDLDNLKAALEGCSPTEVFLTAASPGVVSLFMQDQYYPNHAAYVQAIAEAMKVEYEAIHQAGFLLQVDCPDLAVGDQVKFPDASLAEFKKYVQLHVEALNYALAAIPPDRLRLHLCWGNYEGPHHHDVPLREIIPIVFGARPTAISFEGANPRHEHEWRIFEDVKVPEEKVLIPGVLDSTTNYIEHPELVAQRIVRYATLVGREQVIAGTDCGLATLAGSTLVDPAIAWAKLGAMVEGAALASRELW
jgi:5-methyltetrahydropteroyltriglutamate--homocysteine methyltransferase